MNQQETKGELIVGLEGAVSETLAYFDGAGQRNGANSGLGRLGMFSLTFLTGTTPQPGGSGRLAEVVRPGRYLARPIRRTTPVLHCYGAKPRSAPHGSADCPGSPARGRRDAHDLSLPLSGCRMAARIDRRAARGDNAPLAQPRNGCSPPRRKEKLSERAARRARGGAAPRSLTRRHLGPSPGDGGRPFLRPASPTAGADRRRRDAG